MNGRDFRFHSTMTFYGSTVTGSIHYWPCRPARFIPARLLSPAFTASPDSTSPLARLSGHPDNQDPGEGLADVIILLERSIPPRSFRVVHRRGDLFAVPLLPRLVRGHYPPSTSIDACWRGTRLELCLDLGD